MKKVSTRIFFYNKINKYMYDNNSINSINNSNSSK